MGRHDLGAVIVRRLAADVWLPDWPIVRAEAVREDVLDEELTLPPSSRRYPYRAVPTCSSAAACDGTD